MQKAELPFHPPAANADRQVQMQPEALARTELAFELHRGEAGGFLAADHFRSCLRRDCETPFGLVGEW